MIIREIILDHSCVPTCQVSYEYKMMWVLQQGLCTNIQSWVYWYLLETVCQE